jgi:hypothetical protein
MAEDSDGRIRIGWAREDRAHDTLVKTLARRVVIEGATWDIADSLEHMWIWAGPSGEPDFKVGGELDLSKFSARPIRLHGKLGGQPLAPEASMYRKLLLAFDLATPRPQLVIVARDGDGRVSERRRGFARVVEFCPSSFPAILAMPEPESEAWFICGFQPRTPVEHTRLAELRNRLSFDPIIQSHRLTSRPNDTVTDAKRVLVALVGDDHERRDAGVHETPLAQLARHGEHAGLAEFLDALRRHLLPLLDPRGRPTPS